MNNIIKMDDLDTEFESSWTTPPTNSDNDVSNIITTSINDNIKLEDKDINIDLKDKLDQLKLKGKTILDDYKERGIEILNIDESVIIKDWEDCKYLNVNDNLNYINKLVKSVTDYGYESPRPIQCLTIGQIAKQKDIVVQAQAGNGKTVAFGFGAALVVNPLQYKTQVLILSPTQILTDQITNIVHNITSQTGITVHCHRGGLPIVRDHKTPHIIVGCPGRIIDLINRKKINLNHIKTVILDEGDDLLKLGFKEQIRTIIETLNENVQICLFSATIPKSILELCEKIMINPAYVILPEKKSNYRISISMVC